MFLKSERARLESVAAMSRLMRGAGGGGGGTSVNPILRPRSSACQAQRSLGLTQEVGSYPLSKRTYQQFGTPIMTRDLQGSGSTTSVNAPKLLSKISVKRPVLWSLWERHARLTRFPTKTSGVQLM